MHTDYSDSIGTTAWILALGEDPKGSEFCLPQLGVRIPIKSRMVLAAASSYLAHHNTPLTGGRRVSVVGFTHHNVALWAERRIAKRAADAAKAAADLAAELDADAE